MVAIAERIPVGLRTRYQRLRGYHEPVNHRERQPEAIPSAIESQPQSSFPPILGYYDVWPGMKLNIQENNGVKLGPDGLPIMVMPQLAGVERIQMQFFPIYFKWGWPPEHADNLEIGKDTKFIPLQAYTVADVPDGEKYALFLNNKSVRYKGDIGHHVQARVRVAKEATRRKFKKRIKFTNSYYDTKLNNGEFKIPEGVVFVPIHEMYRPETREHWGMK